MTEGVERSVARLPDGARALVACSGGADSVALAVAVARAGRPSAIGHVDHGLRPESAEEAGKVAALAGRLGVPFFLERIEGLQTSGPGLEAAAREGRYAALARLAVQAGAQVVLTAHTRRDQAETLLLRLFRGAGPGALSGIRRRRELAPGIELQRPLLDVPREETEKFCRENGFDFVQDPHNTDPARMRARLRALWPQLLALNPRIEEALAGAADLLAEENDLLDSLPPGLHPALQRRELLRQANAAGVHPERPHLEELLRLLEKGGGSLDLPGGRATVVFAAPLAIAAPGRYSWSCREVEISGEELTATAPFPWTLRTCRPGDRLGDEKLSDRWGAFPRALRPRLAVIEDASGRVFWAEGLGGPPGIRISPEMKPSAGRLTHERQSRVRSATMSGTPDEETR